MDYLFASSLLGSKIRSIIASYDVACQWYKNFWTRILALPDRLQLPVDPSALTFKVPKFHLASHEQKCQPAFSFNFAKWVGVVNGEGVERLWAWLKGSGPSTTEMGPGNRRGTLDDLCGFSNWRKIVTIGILGVYFYITGPLLTLFPRRQSFTAYVRCYPAGSTTPLRFQTLR